MSIKVYHLKPHFYIAKLGLCRGIPIFFLFLLQNIDCGYRCGSCVYLHVHSMFLAKIRKSKKMLSKFSFFYNLRN